MNTHSNPQNILIIGANSVLAQALYLDYIEQGHQMTLLSRTQPSYIQAKQTTWLACDLERDDMSFLLQKKHFSHYASFYRNRDTDAQSHYLNNYHVHSKLFNYIEEIQQANASIVLCSSPTATTVTDKQSAEYHMAKASLEQQVRFYAVKLGPLNIRVNAISPCLYYKDKPSSLPSTVNNRLEHLAKSIPLLRIAKAKEVANVVEFLLSNKSSYLTGQIIQVDGGLNLRLTEDLAQLK